MRLIAVAFGVLMSLCGLVHAQGAAPMRAHGFALLGELALKPDFPYFPYVNPTAPKGGNVTLGALGSFDSFNPFVLRGVPAAEISRIYDTLMVTSADEPESVYGHVAASLDMPADRMWVAFNLRPEARFHDGVKLTAEDVAWTFNTLLAQGRPMYRQYYADIANVVVENPGRVVFHFKNNENRELPLILGQLVVLPKHWWAGRDFSRGLTEAPLGSGPYRLDRFEMGRSTELVRVADYWAENLPTAKGLNNFGRIRTEYYRDGLVAMEAFKAGQIDFRRENISKNWATSYDFPAVQKGLVKREALTHRMPTGLQGFAMNTRRALFADRRVREAMAQVFDFEWMNRNLFYGAYTRTESFFSNSDLGSTGLPSAEELALLEPYRAKLPAEVFTKPFKMPVTDGSGNNREGLRRALALFKEAGWEIRERRLVGPDGKPMTLEILVDDPTQERIATPFVQWLQRLGIDARVRTVDAAQYQRLTDSFDFDMTPVVMAQSDSLGNEQRDFWSCAASKAEGSMNVAGICDPIVDALIEKIISAPDRAALITASRALDRVLLNNWYFVPNWHLRSIWVAYWNRFGHTATPIRAGLAFESWWVDPVLSAATEAARRNGN
jgi:microcin C transport system substrate-binding protein